MDIYRDLPFCETDYGLCEPGYCFLGTLTRVPKIYRGIEQWARKTAIRRSNVVDLVIPTLGQDHGSEAGLIDGRI